VKRGYIKLYRKITDKADWPGTSKTEFTKFEARIDMVLILATGRINGARARGSFDASLSFLSKRWLWSTGKVRRFLDGLEAEKEIKITKPETEGETKHIPTLITISKYNLFNLF